MIVDDDESRQGDRVRKEDRKCERHGRAGNAVFYARQRVGGEKTPKVGNCVFYVGSGGGPWMGRACSRRGSFPIVTAFKEKGILEMEDMTRGGSTFGQRSADTKQLVRHLGHVIEEWATSICSANERGTNLGTNGRRSMVIRRKGTEWGFPSASGRNEPLSAPLAPVNHPFTRFTHPSSSSLHASTIMSLAGLTASSSNLQPVFNNALQAYERQTKIVLLAHPLAAQLQSCADSPDAILLLLRGQVRELDQSRHGNDKWTKWLDPTVKVIGAFSMALGERVSLVISPAKIIFTGVGVLLSTASDTRAIQDTLVDVFERVGNVFQRLETHIEVPLTTEMVDIVLRIMVEVLSFLAIATKEIRHGPLKKYVKKLVGRTDIEDALQRLDKLTQRGK
ncbi:hypothetical protein DFH94DRAFT_841586 [Russula ochroleuca]|uniref:Fungal STAND N-terminal Goodbye domain-containing protein n=1 Tax=Russula ochroleuca TaxID=152965 RepID=A0A9P5TEB6_9AGAM|nr:hypothetical protein DFH94DRAFT_841586 [Russula ochroleuca]